MKWVECMNSKKLRLWVDTNYTLLSTEKHEKILFWILDFRSLCTLSVYSNSLCGSSTYKTLLPISSSFKSFCTSPGVAVNGSLFDKNCLPSISTPWLSESTTSISTAFSHLNPATAPSLPGWFTIETISWSVHFPVTGFSDSGIRKL